MKTATIPHRNSKAAARALRVAATALAQVQTIAQCLPARDAVDDDAALVMFFDVPRVVDTLHTIAHALDPAGAADAIVDLQELSQEGARS